jgi:hypothetical protein
VLPIFMLVAIVEGRYFSRLNTHAPFDGGESIGSCKTGLACSVTCLIARSARI